MSYRLILINRLINYLRCKSSDFYIFLSYYFNKKTISLVKCKKINNSL